MRGYGQYCPVAKAAEVLGQGPGAALPAGAIELERLATQRSGFTRWFGVSPFSPATRAALAG